MGQKSPDIETLRKAIETRDASSLKALYAADAVMTIIDSINTPSKPRTLRGAAEIGSFLEDVCGRDMTHRLEQGMVDGKYLAFVEGCRYPDGTHVVASSMAELGPNGIVKQTVVQAWDS